MTRNLDRQEFRCSIAAENSAARLRVGSWTYDVNVVDTSRTGIGIRVSNVIAEKLGKRKRLVVIYQGEKWEVEITSRYQDDPHYTVLGTTRRRELTKLPQPSGWNWNWLTQQSCQADPTFLAFLVLAFLVAVISLPGIGDSLGTAPKVRGVLEWLID